MNAKDTIAGAVRRSIRNGEIDAVYLCNEGIAYKAALQRQGANLERMCDAAAADAVLMTKCVAATQSRKSTP